MSERAEQTWRAPGQGRAVLVTGCSTGIGRAVALHLAARGFTVLPTVRRQEDAEDLSRSGPGIFPICPLDLTNPRHVADAGRKVSAVLERLHLGGLYAVVNNAGGGAIAPLELLDVSILRRELETRVVGPLALLQALLPALRAAQGRVLWIVTPGLLPIPFVGSIHVCDFAVNCLARTLRLELRPWNVPVIMVRCGGIKTPAVSRTAQELEQNLKEWPAERARLYTDALRVELQQLAKFDRKRSDPQVVAATVLRALTAKRPRSRYTVGYMARAAVMAELLPQAVVDKVMAWRG
ncbi:MAG: SDR family NAD(P)-dependent oxidoreductase [Calditrichaeota bacterium]|nr:SDR family NAD(P)-dependent oxidoreductase [Calditrichota bacterium]